MTSIRHFLDIDQFDKATLRAILKSAADMKSGAVDGSFVAAGKVLVMIFEKPSTRTRVSFEVGMKQLGGHVVILDPQNSQMGRGETIADTARVLSRYGDAIMIRTDAPERLTELADFASVPVINGLTDASHPCQIMADIQTYEEHRGIIDDKIVTWVGDGNNVAVSWLHAAVKFGFEYRIATPPDYRLPDFMIEAAQSEGGNIIVTIEAADAVDGTDLVLADTWVSMGDDDDRDQRLNDLAPYQVDAPLMALAKPDALFMHCLPAHRGEEVTDDVLDGPQSVVWDEAENRLHAQKGVLAWCLAPGA